MSETEDLRTDETSEGSVVVEKSDPIDTTSADQSAEVALLRQKLADRDAEIETFKSKEKEREDAELSELERTKKQLLQEKEEKKTIADRLYNTMKYNAVIAGLHKNGAGARAEFIARAVDYNNITIEGDKVIGVDAVVSALKAEAPELFSCSYTTAPGAVASKASDKTTAASSSSNVSDKVAGWIAAARGSKEDIKNFK